MIFAREVSEPVTSLVKKVDEATAKYSNCKMGSFVVFCSDEEGLEKKLKEVIDKEKVKKCVFTIDNPSGPADYHVAQDADVTVVLYVEKTVKVNRAFKKGELKDKDIDEIIGDVKQILPEEKK